jgi:chemotaxis protein methyltransferase CheR
MTTESFLATTHFESIDSFEIDRIANLLLEKYHFDLHTYAPTYCKRRIIYLMQKHKVRNVDSLIGRLDNKDFFELFLYDLHVNGIEFFRDTSVWNNLLKTIIEHCNATKEIRVWFPDCGNGEDLYSFEIVLKQFGFYDKCLITASNISSEKIAYIKQGKYEGKGETIDIANYTKLEFSAPASKYFKIVDTAIQLDKKLLDNVDFTNTSAANPINKKGFDLIVFRNAMIAYSRQYQIDVLGNIYNSLSSGGVLIIGVNEQLIMPNLDNRFTVLNSEDRIYQKK